jgi:hypothetical protein
MSFYRMMPLVLQKCTVKHFPGHRCRQNRRKVRFEDFENESQQKIVESVDEILSEKLDVLVPS